jgi:uncharacterized protein Yka (UPF0111/DUF47 family)
LQKEAHHDEERQGHPEDIAEAGNHLQKSSRQTRTDVPDQAKKEEVGELVEALEDRADVRFRTLLGKQL